MNHGVGSGQGLEGVEKDKDLFVCQPSRFCGLPVSSRHKSILPKIFLTNIENHQPKDSRDETNFGVALPCKLGNRGNSP